MSASDPAPQDEPFENGGENEEENAIPNGGEGEAQRRSPGPFGGLDPAEAGRRSAAARRAKAEAAREQAEQDAQQAARALDNRESDLAIVARLRKDAAQGNTQAARELRAWLDSIRDAGDVEEWEALAPHRRDLFEEWLVAQEREQAGGAASPRAQDL